MEEEVEEERWRRQAEFNVDVGTREEEEQGNGRDTQRGRSYYTLTSLRFAMSNSFFPST